MNILHIASTDLRGAGSYVVALNALLSANGHHSKLVVVFKTSKKPDIIGFITFVKNKFLQSLLDRAILCFHRLQTFVKIGKTNPDYYFYNLDERKSNFSAESILKKLDFTPDVIFVHWVSNFINTATIHKLQQLTHARLFWVMVDNAPITGGCHYPWTCKGYETDCSNCPALLTPSKKQIAARNFALKKVHIPSQLQILTLSSPDKMRAEKCSFYAGRKAEVIFHPVNENIFYPQPKFPSQQALSISSDKKIIFFAATTIREKRKGYTELQEALKIFEQEILRKGEDLQDYLLVIAGKQPPVYQGHIPVTYLGYLSEQAMVQAFNAATLFVCPTLEDSGPGILGQAMLCGTPTVAFATGAAVDMIETGRSGYLVNWGESGELSAGINFITHLDAEQYANMERACREIGLKTCSFKAVGDRIEELIK